MVWPLPTSPSTLPTKAWAPDTGASLPLFFILQKLLPPPLAFAFALPFARNLRSQLKLPPESRLPRPAAEAAARGCTRQSPGSRVCPDFTTAWASLGPSVVYFSSSSTRKLTPQEQQRLSLVLPAHHQSPAQCLWDLVGGCPNGPMNGQ